MTHPPCCICCICWGLLRLCTSPSAALLHIISPQLLNQWAKHKQICTGGTAGYLHLFFSPFGYRATGGPEVAMGTGPWPQPPTEAEQLQALMAAANGESCTSLFTTACPITILSSFSFHVSLFPRQGCCMGMVVYLAFGQQATRRTHSLTR